MSIRILTVRRPSLAAAVLACSLAGLAAEARAAIVVNIYQNGSDVRSELSGSFDVSIPVALTTTLSLANAVWGGNGAINSLFFSDTTGGPRAGSRWDGSFSSGPVGATRWGSAPSSFAAATSSAFSGFDVFRFAWLSGSAPQLFIDTAYAGGAMSASASFASTTMATLGLDNYGSYVFTFGSGTTDTVTVNLLQAPPDPGPGGVPLPGAAGLAACGLLGLARRRRR